MTRARDIADLVDANGDIVAGALDNVPASNDASALTTGTLAAARLPTSGISASAVDTGTLPIGQVPSGSVIQMVQSAVNNRLSGTIGGDATPTSTDGTSFHTFTFTPKSSSSALFLWSSNISIYETSNSNDVFYAAAFYDTNTICINYAPILYSNFSSGYNATLISVMGRTSSWGTSQKTIDIRVGAGNGSGNNAQVNWDTTYYNQHGNSPTGSAIQFFMMEVV